jgi:hypothetical protein
MSLGHVCLPRTPACAFAIFSDFKIICIQQRTQPRTYLIIPREPGCCPKARPARRSAPHSSEPTGKRCNTAGRAFGRNPMGTGRFWLMALLRLAHVAWLHRARRVAPWAKSATVAAAGDYEIGSSKLITSHGASFVLAVNGYEHTCATANLVLTSM